MKLVPENINEAIKHLEPKSDKEIEISLEKDLEDISMPYRNPEENYKILKKLADYLDDQVDMSSGPPGKELKVLGTLLWNIDTPVLKEAIKKTINDYMFG